MSGFELVSRLGTLALLRFTAGLLVFVVLHLVRLPLVLAARALEASMRRLDAFVLRGLTRDLANTDITRAAEVSAR